EVLDRARELGLDRGDRLADVAGLELGQLLAVRVNRVSKGVQQARALVRRGLAPRPVECAPGRLDGAVDVLLACHRSGSEPPAGRLALEERSLPLADADAERREAVAPVAAAQLVEERDDEARAAHAEWMADRDGPAVDVHLLLVEPQLAHDGEALRRECLV